MVVVVVEDQLRMVWEWQQTADNAANWLQWKFKEKQGSHAEIGIDSKIEIEEQSPNSMKPSQTVTTGMMFHN